MGDVTFVTEKINLKKRPSTVMFVCLHISVLNVLKIILASIVTYVNAAPVLVRFLK
jgi:hypothetical protein